MVSTRPRRHHSTQAIHRIAGGVSRGECMTPFRSLFCRSGMPHLDRLSILLWNLNPHALATEYSFTEPQILYSLRPNLWRLRHVGTVLDCGQVRRWESAPASGCCSCIHSASVVQSFVISETLF